MIAALLVALLVVAGSFVAFVTSAREARRTEAATVRAVAVEREARAVLSVVLDAETGSRGFLLTGEPQFLDPWERARTQLHPRLNTLTAVSQTGADRPRARMLSRSVRAYFARWTVPLVALARRSPLRARAKVATDEGRRRVDAIRAQVAELTASAVSARRASQARTREGLALATRIGTAGVVVSLVIFAALAAYLAAAVLSPLRAAACAARRLGAGERGVRAPVPRAGGEVADLGRALNELSAALAAAERESERSAAELDRFFAVAPHFMCIADGEGRFRRVSPHFERVLGHPSEVLLSRPYTHFLHPGDVEATERKAGRLAEGEASAAFENRLRRSDGTYVWLRWNAVLSPDDGLIYAAASDVTAQRVAEEEREEARREAEAANAAKSEFLSRMSHELRTPLNSILGFSQIMQMDGLRDDQEKPMGHIVKSGRHLLELINEVLDLASIEAGKLSISNEPVEVAGAVDDATTMVRPLAEARGISIAVGPGTGRGCFAAADQQRLRQILLNLLSNAIKYGTSEVGVDWVTGDGRVRIRVEDDGAGIPAHRLDELFAPFERLGAEAGSEEGTGLGLALSRRLAELMGGTIELESTPGAGTRFSVVLDLSEPPSALARVGDRGASGWRTELNGDGTARLRVLYIEDNLANLRLVEEIIARRDGEVLAAMEGGSGVELARNEQPDLVLLDLHLPDMSGLDVLRELKKWPETRELPVVVLTADATSRTRRRAKEHGADAYLAKPVDVDEFLATVDELVVG